MFVFKLLTFLFLLVLGYFLTPQHIFTGKFFFLGFLFIIFFSVLNYCIIKTIYRNYVYSYKQLGFKKGILASVIGIFALQVCRLSAYACSTTVGFTILATFLPHTLINFLQNFSVEIISISILIQAYSIFYLKCFKINGISLKKYFKLRKSL